MDLTTLHAALRRQPFRPFRIHTIDGATHEVLRVHHAFATTSHFFVGYDIQRHDTPRGAHRLSSAQIARIEWLTVAGFEDPLTRIHGAEETTMEIDGLRAALRRVPFRPFRVFLSDGSHHDVKHPELMVLERRQVALWHGFDRLGFVRDLVLIDALHITRIEPLPDDDSGSKQAG